MKFKKLFPIVIAASLVLTSQIAYAETDTSFDQTDTPVSTNSTIVPFWSYTNLVAPDITIQNGIAKPAIVIQAAYSSAKISGEMYLQQKSGTKWVRVKTWSISGTGTLGVEKSYAVESGETYRCRVVFDVEYNGSSEHIYANSGSVTA